MSHCPIRSARPIGLACLLVLVTQLAAVDHGDLGTFAKWQKVEIVFDGPDSSATATPNPFAIQLDVTFTRPDASTVTIPGFYNGDNQGGSSGDKWLVRFAADATGEWQFSTSSPEASLDGHVGNFTVSAVPGDAEGFYRWGRLEYTGTAANGIRYLRFRDGPWWIKSGTDSPEMYLSVASSHYYNTNELRKQGVDYLKSQGINSMYLMIGNIGGDAPGLIWPWLGSTLSEVAQNAGSDSDPGNEALDDPAVRFNISRLAEFLDFFEHMQGQGVVIYLIGQDDDSSSDYNHARYYREFIARFGWMPGIMFNDKEESGFIPRAVQFSEMDPYGIPTASHNYNRPESERVLTYIDEEHLDMTSIQSAPNDDSSKKAGGGLLHNRTTIDFINACKSRGKRVLMVSFDEPRGGSVDRQQWWAAYLGGAGGYEEIITGIGANGGTFEDHHSIWVQLGGARAFMEAFDFWEMNPRNDLITSGNAFCLATPGDEYAVYLIDGADFTIDLVSGNDYEISWWNPLNGYGGAFQDTGSIIGGGQVTLQPPAGGPEQGDWGVRIVKTGGEANVPPSADDGLVVVDPGASVDITLSYTDPDGPGPHSVRIVDQPVNGILSGSGSAWTYTCDAEAEPGSDVFTWEVDDGLAVSNLATVDITIDDPANNAPVAEDAEEITQQGVAVSVALLFDDPDSFGPFIIDIVNPPAHGSVEPTTAGGNEYRYTPEAGFVGIDRFQWTVDDGDLASAPATVTVIVQSSDASLLAHWPLDQVAGDTLAIDITGNGYDASLLNADPTQAWVAGPRAGAVAVPSNDAHLATGQPYAPTERGTLAFWCWRADGGSGDVLGRNKAFSVDIDSEGFITHDLLRVGLDANVSIPVTTWAHVACTWDRSSGSAGIWIDGAAAGSRTASFSEVSDFLFTIGRKSATSSGGFRGSFDDVRIYDRVLSTSEIDALANGSLSAAPVIDSGPSAGDNPVTTTGTTLAVTASDPDDDEADLIYTWSMTSGPASAPAPTFTPNASNDAKNSTVTFQMAGTYEIRIQVRDPSGANTTDLLTIDVQQRPVSLDIEP